jgi:hypothetical protein
MRSDSVFNPDKLESVADDESEDESGCMVLEFTCPPSSDPIVADSVVAADEIVAKLVSPCIEIVVLLMSELA